MRSIGELARDSGLTVSALRFYDGAGVLVPSWVDPDSGYRWYAPEQLGEARLLARLRRVRMPLADIRLILAGWSSEDASLVRTLLDAHLLRLESGLADARRELSSVRALLALRETPVNTTATSTTRLTLSASELAGALGSVRFAVSTDDALPMLGGVLFDADADADADGAAGAGTGSLRLAATDRYRMALSGASAGFDGPSARAVVPAALVDAMRALLGGSAEGEAVLSLEGDRVALEVGGSQAAGVRLDADFPDYRRLSRLPAGRLVPVDVAALRRALAEGPTRIQRREQDGAEFEISVLALAADDTITVEAPDAAPAEEPDAAPGGPSGDGTLRVAVNRQFLLDALRLDGREQLLLEVGGPVTPLAIRLPEPGADSFSLLMPVRLTS
ncbi:MerR family transcriptional regulator [Streptacidiphilus sp. PB12-B1b]|uniref:DNA polymerase III subunit beta family protein n=1 Tax=Streptacidiphilus sp. PB12-B1b TaxID=2705012 RepID=UPI0015FC43F2|nr:MerR family transcriptional regulator [Streptacidiphilus sp. PB12-B1b]